MISLRGVTNLLVLPVNVGSNEYVIAYAASRLQFFTGMISFLAFDIVAVYLVASAVRRRWRAGLSA